MFDSWLCWLAYLALDLFMYFRILVCRYLFIVEDFCVFLHFSVFLPLVLSCFAISPLRGFAVGFHVAH